MMKTLLLIICTGFIFFASAQSNTAAQMQQANNLLKQFKEAEALDIYKQIAAQENTNIEALVKCTELNCAIGERETDAATKKNYFLAAKEYADKALAADSNSADANYLEALAYGKLSSIEDESKKTIQDVIQIKAFADKALSLNPNHARANYIEGKWHYEMLTLNVFKKAALKVMYGHSIPKPDIDSAINYMEKCKTLEPYFMQNYFDLAKAYGYKNRPAQQMDVLNKMIKLPNRTADDAALKEQGRKALHDLQ